MGATALGSVMGLTFSGAYLAGGMANAAVVRAEVTRVGDPVPASAEAADAVSTPAVSISSNRFEISNRTGGYALIGPTSDGKGGFSALGDRLDRAPTTVGGFDADAKLSIFRETYGSSATDDYKVRKTSRELDCLTAALYYEARGEGQSGMEAVAQVIVNRVRHPSFPKSLCGVIYQGAGKGRGCQFSFACDGSMRRRSETALWDRARAVAERAMEGRVSHTVGNSTFFHATRISPNWRGLTRVATVGRHVFYRHAGARGSAGMLAKGSVGAGYDAAPEVAIAESKARVYKVSSDEGRGRSAPATKATFTADLETPVLVAEPEITVTPDSEPVQTLSLDAIVDAAVPTTES